MSVLVWGLVLIAMAFLLHLVIWKIHLPQRQTKVLLLIFFGTLLGALVFLWTHPEFSLFGLAAPVRWTGFLHIAILFTAFTLAYVITYSGLEADSPSLVMVMTIAQTGDSGLGKDEFHRQMTDDTLVKPRVRDLLIDRMAVLEGERYCLTPKGKLFSRIFMTYRAILRAGKGG